LVFFVWIKSALGGHHHQIAARGLICDRLRMDVLAHAGSLADRWQHIARKHSVLDASRVLQKFLGCVGGGVTRVSLF